ncbi:MAG: M3 family metallopeptidase [Bdellovibrionaceae bacterium]|nr:M3 family metallopeptidase [Pseudobdellovibrionaceae bacterium]
MNTQNPILKKSPYSHNAIDFKSIQTQHFLPALEESLALAKRRIETIKSHSKATFENTIVALEEATEELSFVSHLFHNLLYANSNDELHSLSEIIHPLIASFDNDIHLDSDLFSKVKSIYEQRAKLKLNSEDSRLLLDTYLSFTRNGSQLNDKDKSTLRNIDEELAVLGPQFSKNVTQAINEYQLVIKDSKDLSGLPESVVKVAKHEAEEKKLEGWLFTLQMPSYLPFVRYCDHRDLRKEMVTAYARMNTTGPYNNQPLILKTLKLREQRAKLLAYKNHSEYVLEQSMAKTPEKVQHFLLELLEVAKPACKKEIKELQEYVDKIGGPNPIQSWDFDYYSTKFKKEKFHFDEQELRPYFQLEKVVKGVFAVAEKLFNIEFKRNKEYPVYHPDVEVYEVYEKNGEYMGLLYKDFFPHANKNAGAWMTSYRQQGLYQGKIHRPHVSIVCNFTRSTPDHPSLLTLREVETLFHEFGHALHGLLSKCHYRSHSGTNVYRDFVELPSQIMENWVEEKETLDLFAVHYQSGEKMPEELIKKIKAVSQFQSGYANLRQLQFAMLDMAYHNTAAEKIIDVIEFENQVTKDLKPFPIIEGGSTSVSFQHIFAGGYSSGYYSYKWAEVLDADAFEKFKEDGIFNAKTAQSFKENILERGGAEHPMELYKAFRGHEPDTKALLRRDGLL